MLRAYSLPHAQKAPTLPSFVHGLPTENNQIQTGTWLRCATVAGTWSCTYPHTFTLAILILQDVKLNGDNVDFFVFVLVFGPWHNSTTYYLLPLEHYYLLLEHDNMLKLGTLPYSTSSFFSLFPCNIQCYIRFRTFSRSRRSRASPRERFLGRGCQDSIEREWFRKPWPGSVVLTSPAKNK